MLVLFLDLVFSINTYFVRKDFIFSALRLLKNKTSFNSPAQVIFCVNSSCSSARPVTDGGAISVSFKLSAVFAHPFFCVGQALLEEAEFTTTKL